MVGFGVRWEDEAEYRLLKKKFCPTLETSATSKEFEHLLVTLIPHQIFSPLISSKELLLLIITSSSPRPQTH